MTISLRWYHVLALVAPLLLGGCQSTRQRIADCKVGDWKAIGQRDGADGVAPNYADRRDFCEGYDSGTIKADPAANYAAGWAQGNSDYWAGLGEVDGRSGLPLATYDGRVASADVRKKMTPLNEPAYAAGWATGLSSYWNSIGKRDGTAGRALGQKEGVRMAAAAQGIRFDEAAWTTGWQVGNRTFWQDAGFQDARNGVPDSALSRRATAARSAGVQVQEDAYRQAWNDEIVNYWKQLGSTDAVSGKDFGMRRAEAQQKGLRIFETEYRQAWERRLTDYWSKLGHDDGYGQPFLLERRLSEAQLTGVFVLPNTRELYGQAWTAENIRYCNPENAFETGRHNAGMAVEVCPVQQQNMLKRAYLSGQDYEIAAARFARAQSDTHAAEHRLYETRHALERLDKEIRSAREDKNRVINEESARQDKRREQERRELVEALVKIDQHLTEARRWEERLQRDMERLRRDIYLN
jgi:hypothetical protein